jgi:DNA-binding CsgD family transcriptional regulator
MKAATGPVAARSSLTPLMSVKRSATQTRIRQEIVEGIRESHRNPGATNRTVTKRDSRARGSTAKRDAASWVTWQSALYLFVLGWICLVLVPLTNFWWLALICGMATPIVLATLNGAGPASKRPGDQNLKERELLDVLAERGEITPTTAVMRTSLTVDEASRMLHGLARKGHLEVQAEDGVMAYVLRDRREHSTPSETESDGAAPRLEAQQLDDPLSERELEVLRLLASGRTSAEVARHRFVAVGTVKSHTGNIYRKLGARNRAEALARARKLELLS